MSTATSPGQEIRRSIRRSFLVALVSLPTFGVSANDPGENAELWDLYPSRLEVRQYAEAREVARVETTVFAFDPALDSLTGVPVSLEVADSPGTVTLKPSETNDLTVETEAAWQWTTVFGETFEVAGCQFSYARDLGALRLDFSEGYQLGQREVLAWSGLSGVCPDRLAHYLASTAMTPVMPLHFGDWQALGTPLSPADSGRVEVRVITDLRRTRRLLPLEATAELDADPFTGMLPSLGEGPARFALIVARLGTTVFTADFEP